MKTITVQSTVNADIKKVWDFWTKKEHIINWNFASDEWHCPSAHNNLAEGGDFSWRMEAKDGSMGFDYKGTYTLINAHERIEFTLDDGRQVAVTFTEEDGITKIVESFEPDANDPELQKLGWQAILNNFKKYTEENQ
jgi:uncharacterized protein YndB with AHSA1/START domain